MRDERLNIVLVFLAMSVVLLWTALPDQGLIQPFPLSSQQIYFQTYIWIGTIYVSFLILAWVMYRQADESKSFFNAVFICQACQFIEYWINYNDPWGHIGIIPVHMATIRLPILFVCAVITFMKWKT